MPPPIGGIASITATLRRELGAGSGIGFQEPVAREDGPRGMLVRLRNLLLLARGTLRLERGGSVLFFSSSRSSFWEKLSWALVVWMLGRTAVIVMVAGDFPSVYAKEPVLFRRVSAWLMRQDRVRLAVQSPAWSEVYAELFPGSTIRVVRATVAPEFFAGSEHPSLPRDRLTALFVGWIIPDKGILDLFDAIALVLAEREHEVTFRLVGPIFGRDEFWSREAHRRGIAEVTTLVGPVPDRPDIVREYRDADLFVFPSHYEGYPVALIEAIASGLPCVSTDVGGVRDILDDGRAGIIVPVQDPGALADGILQLIRDPERRAHVGAAAAEHARSHFTISSFIDSYRRALA